MSCTIPVYASQINSPHTAKQPYIMKYRYVLQVFPVHSSLLIIFVTQEAKVAQLLYSMYIQYSLVTVQFLLPCSTIQHSVGSSGSSGYFLNDNQLSSIHWRILSLVLGLTQFLKLGTNICTSPHSTLVSTECGHFGLKHKCGARLLLGT